MQMHDQIQAMYLYIDALESSRVELQTLLSKYHNDNCKTCETAYKNDEKTEQAMQDFYALMRDKFQSREWIGQE